MMDTVYSILIVLVCVGVFYLVPYYLRKLVPLNTLQQAEDIIQQIVYMLEQTMTNVDGEVKKEKAVTLAKELLRKAGINISDEMLDTLIEAAVFIMNTTLLKPNI